jgi:trans-2,3-dihydro-3-hydroxyanthranilate isomerase
VTSHLDSPSSNGPVNDTCLRFYIVDVFAESRLSGNQLAVFRDCSNLSTAMMQRIAQEMHYSETTFITSESPRDGGYDVRIFTPSQELPFAGHPTLGTAYIVQSQILGKSVDMVTLNMKVGQIPVTFSYRNGTPNVLWMRQKRPTFGKTFDRDRIAKILGLRDADIDHKFPIRLVSTGVPFVIVPLANLKAIKGIRVDQVGLAKLFKETRSTVILCFNPETYSKENDLNVRVFGLASEIPEDPATGSGNGCLAAYLVKERYFEKTQVDIRVEQGYEIGRQSLLLLRAKENPTGIDVDVGGKVQFVAKGEFPG